MFNVFITTTPNHYHVTSYGPEGFLYFTGNDHPEYDFVFVGNKAKMELACKIANVFYQDNSF